MLWGFSFPSAHTTAAVNWLGFSFCTQSGCSFRRLRKELKVSGTQRDFTWLHFKFIRKSLSKQKEIQTAATVSFHLQRSKYSTRINSKKWSKINPLFFLIWTWLTFFNRYIISSSKVILFSSVFSSSEKMLLISVCRPPVVWTPVWLCFVCFLAVVQSFSFYLASSIMNQISVILIWRLPACCAALQTAATQRESTLDRWIVQCEIIDCVAWSRCSRSTVTAYGCYITDGWPPLRWTYISMATTPPVGRRGDGGEGVSKAGRSRLSSFTECVLIVA